MRNKNSFTLTVPWNLAKLVKISPGIIARQHHTGQKQMERAVRRVKEGTSAVLLQSGLNESWWADSMECYTYLRNVTDLLSDGKTPYERRFGQPCKGPIIPFGSLVELSPCNCEGPVKNINLERKFYLNCSPDTHCTRGDFGRVTYWLQTLRSWKRWTHLKSTRKDSMRKR